MPNTPAHKFRIGLINTTVWNNDGFYSVDLTRSYKDGDGNWNTSTSFGHADLLNLSKCAQRAETWIAGQANA